MDRILHVLIGDVDGVLDAVIKTSALFLTAAILFRFTERRTLAEFAPFRLDRCGRRRRHRG